MMLDGVSDKRIQAMSPQERRWLENAKKAFLAIDEAFCSSAPQDECLSLPSIRHD